jgi:hypothetical protein
VATDERAALVILRESFGWRSLIDPKIRTEADRRADLIGRIRAGDAFAPEFTRALSGLWPDEVPTFAEADTHTHGQLDLIADAVGQAEAVFAIPF